MELNADEPGVVLDLDDLGKLSIGRHAAEDQPALFQLVAVLDVDLVTVAVAFLDHRGAVDARDGGAFLQVRGIGPKAHGAALGVCRLAGHGVVALNPFLQVVNDRGEAFGAGLVVKLLGPCVL